MLFHYDLSQDIEYRSLYYTGGFPSGPVIKKKPPAMQEARVLSLGHEDPLEEGMATHCSLIARKIPWTEEAGMLESLGSQRGGHY